MKENPASAIQKLMLLSFKSQFYNPSLLDSLSLKIPVDYMARSGAFQRLGPDLMSFDLYNDLANLKMPVLITYGDFEPAAELSGKPLHQIILNSDFVVIKNSGHFPFVEQPHRYFETINEFLER